MKTTQYIRSLSAERLKNNAAVKVALEARLPVGHKEETWDDEFWQKPLGDQTLRERFKALSQKGGGWQYGSPWNDLFEAVTKKPEAYQSFVMNGEFIHRVHNNDAVAGYHKIRETGQGFWSNKAVWSRRYEIRELLLTAWEDLRNQVRAFKALRREFVGLLDKLPFGLKPGPDADQIGEIRSYALPWVKEAVADYNIGRWPKQPCRKFVSEIPVWLTYRCVCNGGPSADPWHHLVPMQVREALIKEFPASDPRNEVFTRLQEAGVAVSLWFDGDIMRTERAQAMGIISAYKAEQVSEFNRGVRDGKRAFRQNKRADVHSPKGGSVHDWSLNQSQSAYKEGCTRGFREARERFIAKLQRRYLKLGAGNTAAKQLAGFAAYPNWRANLSGWFGATKEFLCRGVKVSEIRSLKTELIQWEVGGTYRHRHLLVCDPTTVRQVLKGVPSDHMSPQGGATVRSMFGCTSKSRAGYVITDEGVEVYADQ